MTVLDEIAQIQALEARAAHLRELLDKEFARRAFVLEFAGTPKSGKSTSVEAARHFFARNGFRVHVLAERAAMCPIPMKGHLFFNTWCMASMLAELLANFETETDLIIVDRGLMDSLVWLVMQKARGEITATDASCFESFVLLDRWVSLIDLALVLYVDPDEALKRERSQCIATADGSIMNRNMLTAISGVVDDAVNRYRAKFKHVVKCKSEGGVRSFNMSLIDRIIDNFDEFLDPNILVVKRQHLFEANITSGGYFSTTDTSRFNSVLSVSGQFEKRSKAEDDKDFVQIVACAVLMHMGKVFIFERQTKDPKSSLYGKRTLCHATHVPEKVSQTPQQCTVSACRDRVNSSLFLGQNLACSEIGYCWINNDKHLGVLFRVDIESDLTARDLEKKEFRRSRGFGLSGKLIDWSDLLTKEAEYNLEPWSQELLHNYKLANG
jgi:predicted NUDIX family phosphoesterase